MTTMQGTGKQIARSLYIESTANIYQVRDNDQRKLAQFSNYEETRAFLRSRDKSQIQVWLLEKSNGELIDICSGKDFVEKYG